MDIIRTSVWLSQGTDLLAEGLYRVLDFDRKVDLLILFKIKSERTGKPIPFSFSMFKYYIESNSITCKDYILSLIHISEPTRQLILSRMPSSA